MAEGESPIIRAVVSGDVAEVSGLLDASPGLVNSRGRYRGWTPLMEAASRGSATLVQLLLDRGASVDLSYGRSSSPPLSLAVAKGHEEVVALLLQRGARLSLRSQAGGPTALMLASFHGHLPIVRRLLRCPGVWVDEADKERETAVGR